MATSSIRRELATSLNTANIQAAQTWLSLADWRVYKKGNLVYVYGAFISNNNSGSDYGNDQGHTLLALGLPFSTASRQYLVAMLTNTSLNGNNLMYIDVVGDELYMSFSKILNGSSGRIVVNGVFMVS